VLVVVDEVELTRPVLRSDRVWRQAKRVDIAEGERDQAAEWDVSGQCHNRQTRSVVW
jgi:hypothetical protein